MSLLQHWRLNASHIASQLNQPWLAQVALWLIPFMFGLLSMKLGQDANWDLLNYHLYNPFAFLNGKIGVDLVPAQMQSYFNPTIDLLYYGLVHVLPGPFVSFTMGMLHGLNFILVVMIVDSLLPAKSEGARMAKVLLLALAGVCSNGFISEIGNTMGDNLIALAVLGSLVVLLRNWPRLTAGAGISALLSAGALMGIGVGLKLTAAVFALSLCVSLLLLPLTLIARVRATFLFGIGVIVGIALAGGHWYWKMWTMFGNPFFPQFNSVFQNPLAGPISVADTRFLPHGLVEYLLWPFIFIFDPVRVSEMKIADPIWPLLYVAGAALLTKFLLRPRLTPAVYPDNVNRSGQVTVVAVFFVLSYLTWMVLFSIYRYLVPVELLAPLMLWLCARALLPRVIAGKIVAVLLLAIVASNFFPRLNWGYAPPARSPVHAETPSFTNPAQSIVFTLHHDRPSGWLIPQFPKELAFVALDSNFPESAAFRQRVNSMVAERSGPMYAMFDVSGTEVDHSVYDSQRARSKLTYSALLKGASEVLSARDLVLDSTSCITWMAHLGSRERPYQMCRVQSKRT
jgi:hypothetical protein